MQFALSRRVCFDALGGAHPRSFLLPVQIETNQRKRPPTTCPLLAACAVERDRPAASPLRRASARVNCLGPSLALALRAPQAATGRLLSALSRAMPTQTCTRLFPEGRREVGAQRRPSRGVPFLFVPFLRASKEKGPACGAAPHSNPGCAPPRTSKKSASPIQACAQCCAATNDTGCRVVPWPSQIIVCRSDVIADRTKSKLCTSMTGKPGSRRWQSGR